MAKDEEAGNEYLVITDALAGGSVYQTRRKFEADNLHDLLKKLVDHELPRNDNIFSLRIERITY